MTSLRLRSTILVVLCVIALASVVSAQTGKRVCWSLDSPPHATIQDLYDSSVDYPCNNPVDVSAASCNIQRKQACVLDTGVLSSDWATYCPAETVPDASWVLNGEEYELAADVPLPACTYATICTSTEADWSSNSFDAALYPCSASDKVDSCTEASCGTVTVFKTCVRHATGGQTSDFLVVADGKNCAPNNGNTVSPTADTTSDDHTCCTIACGEAGEACDDASWTPLLSTLCAYDSSATRSLYCGVLDIWADTHTYTAIADATNCKDVTRPETSATGTKACVVCSTSSDTAASAMTSANVCDKTNFNCGATCDTLTYFSSCLYLVGGTPTLTSAFANCGQAVPSGATTGDFYSHDPLTCCEALCQVPESSPIQYETCADSHFSPPLAEQCPDQESTRVVYCKSVADAFAASPDDVYTTVEITDETSPCQPLPPPASKADGTQSCASAVMCVKTDDLVTVNADFDKAAFDSSVYACTSPNYTCSSTTCAPLEFSKTCRYLDSSVWTLTSDLTKCGQSASTRAPSTTDARYIDYNVECCAIKCSDVTDEYVDCGAFTGFSLTDAKCTDAKTRTLYCATPENPATSEGQFSYGPITIADGQADICNSVYDTGTNYPVNLVQTCSTPAWVCYDAASAVTESPFTMPAPTTSCDNFCGADASTHATCFSTGTVGTDTRTYQSDACTAPVCTAARCAAASISQSSPLEPVALQTCSDMCSDAQYQCSYATIYGACYTKSSAGVWALSTNSADCSSFSAVVNTYDSATNNFIQTDGCFDTDACTEKCAFYEDFGTSTATELTTAGTIFDCADVQSKFLAKGGDFNDVSVTCAGFSFEYYQVRYVEDGSAAPHKKTASFTDTSSQCQYLCAGADGKHATCPATDSCTSCSVCRNSVATEYSLDASVVGACSALTPSCLCSASCAPFASEAAVVGEDVPVGTVVCTANTFRPIDSWCLIDTVKPSDVRKVFCTLGNKVSSTDAAECDWTQDEATAWTSSTTDCTYDFLCGEDAASLEQCTCPGGANNDDCDLSNIVDSPSTTCSISHAGTTGTFTTEPHKCCDKQTDKNCVCPCLNFEWRCFCHNDPANPTNSVPCDCDTPQTSQDTCSHGDCRVYPLSVQCWDSTSNAAAAQESSCSAPSKPTETSYTCTPTDELDAASSPTTCTNVAVMCTNNNGGAAYACNTCVDSVFDAAPTTATRAVSRTAVCSATFVGLDGQPQATPTTIPCNSASIASQATCVGAFTLTPPQSPALAWSRGEELTYTWTYIGASTTDSLIISTVTDQPVPNSDMLFQVPDNNGATSTVTLAARQFKYTTPADVMMPFESHLFVQKPTETKATSVATATINFSCDPTTPECVTTYCTAENRVCPATGGTCSINSTTSFTQCVCNSGFSGDKCQFDKMCTDTGFCTQHGNALSFDASPSGQCAAGSTTCQCTGAWAGAQCAECTATGLNALCVKDHFVPSTSSKACACDCFAGYGGPGCANGVVYASFISSLAPPSAVTVGTSYEPQINSATLASTFFGVSVFFNAVNTSFRKVTSIPTFTMLEVRAVSGQTNQYQYIFRWNTDPAVDYNVQWEAYRESLSFQIQAVVSPGQNVISTQAAYDPVCVASGAANCPTGTSFYPAAVAPVVCADGSTDPICQTGFPGVDPNTEDPASDDDEGLSGGIIAIIVIFSILGAILIVLLIIFCVLRNRNAQGGAKSGFVDAQDAEPFPFQDDNDGRSSMEHKSRPKKSSAPPPAAASTPPTRPAAPSDPKAKKSVEMTDRKASRRTNEAGDNALPHPWKMCNDHLGNTYYLNMQTLESTFTKPIA